MDGPIFPARADPDAGANATAPINDQPVTSMQVHDAALSICRICRGEGSLSEPLFYPCKCSGSIKYVHQDCLMEWLSHSQKKHCDLCKTPFRFTKLYDPDMPQTLPIHVFLDHMARYVFRNALVWLRAVVAISIWICWLPYFMRAVWSFMFWVSDDGWVSSSLLSRGVMSAGSVEYSATTLGLDTCPASPLLASDTTPAAAAEAMINGSSRVNVVEITLRLVLAMLGIVVHIDLSSGPPHPAHSHGSSQSLLSETAWIRRLTGNSVVHRVVVSVLEGQIITVIVIVSFILVILVRDYVVQQQPELNMRAAFAVPNVPENDNQEDQPPPELPEVNEPPPMRPRDAESDDETLDDGDLTAVAPAEPSDDLPSDQPSAQQRPPVPEASSANAPVPDMQPQPDVQQRRRVDQRASVSDYLRIYRRADGDPQEMLRIADREGMREGLAYWMDVSRRSMYNNPYATGSADSGAMPSGSNYPIWPGPGSDSSEQGASGTMLTPDSNDSLANEASRAEAKGKQRELPREAEPDALVFNSRRPRSVSDGPQAGHRVNPLANNGWSFARLPDKPAPPSNMQQSPNAGESPAQGSGSESTKGVDTANIEPPPFPGFGGDSLANTYGDPSSPIPNSHGNWSFASVPNEAHGLGRGPFESSSGEPVSNGINEALLSPGDTPIVETETAEGPSSHHPSQPVINDVREPAPPPEQADALPAPAERPVAAEHAPQGLWDRMAHFMWGDIEEPEGHDEDLQLDDNMADDDLWEDEPEEDEAFEVVDPDQAMNDAGMDAEVIDDMDDFDGVMELIGMRGPVAGLFQNAIFCAVLVTVTIFACIFIPYNVGRIAVWILANPVRLFRLLFELSKLVQDTAIMLGGFASWCALNLVDMVTGLVGGPIARHIVTARKASWGLWLSAGSRVTDFLLMGFPVSAMELQNFSAISHHALNTVKAQVVTLALAVTTPLTDVSGIFSAVVNGDALRAAASTYQTVLAGFQGFSSALVNPNSWVVNLGGAETPIAIDPALTHWSGQDRFWAILAGYGTIFCLGTMYLRRGTPFSRGNIMQAWEAGIIDMLHQASGIMKVIVIISIEILVFPLYCGLLLDVALLPLFEGASMKSRILFTYNYPLTSVFVHWFVGTGYMFHFALFVFMCRKIMRRGVLYFIRDPDDPEFHPVRAVLERNLTPQLRKILFSAFVYGALVVVCLGGVVWGLAYAMPDGLPIHYSSNEPVLEFPVDLLFYNFLLPLAIKYLKPGEGLQTMYTWWFRKCARALRLTYFLFGERRIDEEGILQLGPQSRFNELPAYRRYLLELSENNEVVPKTWRDSFEGADAEPNPSLSGRDMRVLRHKKAQLVERGQLVKSGRFVRAPASDRVKIPKGKMVFLTVTERDHRKDDRPDDDIYASNQYRVVYIPPHFRTRIFLFILFIWMFAAITGVGFTIVPLSFGRLVFKMLIPEHIKTNDIYAFSIGIYVLGSLSWLAFHARLLSSRIQARLQNARQHVRIAQVGHQMAAVGLRGLKLVYAYSFLLCVFPLVIAALLELYVLLPLHTWLNPPTLASQQSATETPERHTVRVVQMWTIGLLYMRLGARTIWAFFPGSRLEIAVRTVLGRGWLRPDIGVLTRAFVVPGLFVAALAILGPPSFTSLLARYGAFENGQSVAGEAAEALRMAMIYRKSYPATALAAMMLLNGVKMMRVVHGWTARIRDEAYLIGERLHNLGPAPMSGKKVAARPWRAGRPRL